MTDLASMWWCPPVWHVPDPCVAVTLPGGIELLSEEGYSQVEFTLSSWDGWTNGPDVQGGGVPWESADGGVPGEVRLGGLSMAFDGMIHARSASHLWELQEALGSVLTRDRWGWVQVDESHLGLSRVSWVSRGGRPTITPLTDTLARYSVQVASASPFRLGVDQQSEVISSSGVNLRNIGNHDAAVTATLEGPLTTPGISWDGKFWRYSSNVPSGTTLIVDMRSQVVRNPATAGRSEHRAAGDWIELPPGDTTVERTGSGSGSIELSWRSTWA